MEIARQEPPDLGFERTHVILVNPKRKGKECLGVQSDEAGKGAAAAKSHQSCLTLCDLIDGSPPGSSVHGIFQARVLKWGAIAFSKMGS